MPNEFAECVSTCSHFRTPGPNGEPHWCSLLDMGSPHFCEPYIENVLKLVERLRKLVHEEYGPHALKFFPDVDGPDTGELSLVRRLKQFLEETAIE
jgi:hypothetical protein